MYNCVSENIVTLKFDIFFPFCIVLFVKQMLQGLLQVYVQILLLYEEKHS